MDATPSHPTTLAATSTRPVRADLTRIRAMVAGWARDAVGSARGRVRVRHLPAIVFLVGLFLDTASTSFLGLVPGIAEDSPGARAGMELLGGPQLYMVWWLVLLAPATVLLAGRPVGMLARGVWWLLFGFGLLKLVVGVNNVVLMLQA